MVEVNLVLPDGTWLSDVELVRQFGSDTPIAQITETLGVSPIILGEPIRILPQDIPAESIVRVSGTRPHVNFPSIRE